MTRWTPRLVALLLGTFALAGLARAELHSFTNLDRLIPDGSSSGLSDSRSVTSSIVTLGQVRLSLRIVGEFNGDLYGYVRHIHAGGTNFCVLLNRPGRVDTNSLGYPDSGLNLTFADGAANGDIHVYRQVTTPASGAPLTGIWQPDGRAVDPAVATDASPRTTTLGSFSGANASGEWTLYLADIESGGSNLLAGWELELTGATAPAVTWPAPADIVYGTPLGAGQLNASAPVTGTFSYSPSSGTVLNAGTSQALGVTFTPQDTTNYTVVTTNVAITVLQKSLTITAGSTNKVYGAPLPDFTASYAGFANGDGPASLDSPVLLATPATAGSDVGSYSIEPSGAADANYSISFVPGVLQVTPASSAGVLASSANPAIPGSPVIFTCTLSAIAPGAGTPAGAVQFKVDGVNAGPAVALSGGLASLNLSDLTVGWHTIRAEYAGSLNFRGTTNDLLPAQLINTPPVAGPDTIERWPTNGTKVQIATLLANDSDADGDTLNFLSFTTNSVHGGTLTQSNGWLLYTPPSGFTNDDAFTYTIGDGRGQPVTGMVAVAIQSDTAPSSNLTIARLADGSYQIRFNGIPGRTYRIEYTEIVIPAVWQSLGTATADGTGLFEYIDTSPEGSSGRYYRSVSP